VSHKSSCQQKKRLLSACLSGVCVCVCVARHAQVIADGIFISGSSVKTDEAAITGESDNVVKDVANDPFMLSGTSMAAGTCNMLVTAVGVRSTQVRPGCHTHCFPLWGLSVQCRVF
jgi:high-affinity K+ transport system ATPase subunit B